MTSHDTEKLNAPKNILVTGGAGYIGSHTCVELLQAGFNVVVVDNLVNSKRESLNRVQKITGKTLLFYEVDLLDQGSLDKVFDESSIDAVIYFAGLRKLPKNNLRILFALLLVFYVVITGT